MFSQRVQTCCPSPSQRIRSRAEIAQMPHEKTSTCLPVQPEGENPDRGKPHPRMIMQIGSGFQLFCPMIKWRYSGLP